MADEIIDEVSNLAAELIGFIGKLRERFGEAVRDLHVPTAEFAHEFHIVVAGNAQRVTAGDSVDGELENLWNFWTAINKVAKEDKFPAICRLHGERRFVNSMTKAAQQLD